MENAQLREKLAEISRNKAAEDTEIELLKVTATKIASVPAPQLSALSEDEILTFVDTLVDNGFCEPRNRVELSVKLAKKASHILDVVTHIASLSASAPATGKGVRKLAAARPQTDSSSQEEVEDWGEMVRNGA